MDFATRLKSRIFGNSRTSQEERYAREATSLVDLEMRDREIAKGRFARTR